MVALCCDSFGSVTKLMGNVRCFNWFWVLYETFVSFLVILFVCSKTNLSGYGGYLPGFVLNPR